MHKHVPRIVRSIWVLWMICIFAYGVNIFIRPTISPVAAALLLAAAASVALLLYEIIMRMGQRSAARDEQQRQVITARERAAAVAKTWPEQLLSVSVRYLHRRDLQQRLHERWIESGPTPQLVSSIFTLRSQSMADAHYCLQLKQLALDTLDDPPAKLLALSDLLNRACALTSLWAPGDELDELLPDMNDLAPFTMSDADEHPAPASSSSST